MTKRKIQSNEKEYIESRAIDAKFSKNYTPSILMDDNNSSVRFVLYLNSSSIYGFFALEAHILIIMDQKFVILEDRLPMQKEKFSIFRELLSIEPF